MHGIYPESSYGEKIKVKEQHLQMDLKNLQGRSLLLDCLCEDEDGKLYNIEMQNDLEGASPKRARYHASLLDMHSLDAGEKFRCRRKVHTITGKLCYIYREERYTEFTETDLLCGQKD